VQREPAQDTSLAGAGLIAPANLANLTRPNNCFTFIAVDPTGRGFGRVQPPTAPNQGGVLCGSPLG
jgi:hypothetical protein